MDFRESLQDDINRVSRFPDVRGAQNILAALEKIKAGVNMPNSTNLEENDGFYFSKEARDLFMAAHKELKGTKVIDEGEVSLEIKVRRSIETFKNSHKEAPSSEKICVICMEEYKFGNMNIHLDCQHKFHYKCLKEWKKEKDSCPFCKKKFEMDFF